MNPNVGGHRLEGTPAIRAYASGMPDRRVLEHKGEGQVRPHDAVKTRAARR